MSWLWLAAAFVACDARRTFGVSLKQRQLDGRKFPTGQEVDVFNHTCQVMATEPQVCIMQHFWAGGSFGGYERSIVRYYVDGEGDASVAIPFGLGLGSDMLAQHAPWSAGALFGKTGQPSGIFHNYHIPFARSVRVTVSLGGSGEQDFWIILKGTSGLLPRIGGETLPPGARARTFLNEPAAVAGSGRMPLVQSDARDGAVLMTSLFVNWTDPTEAGVCSSELVGEGLDMFGGDLGSPIFAANADDCTAKCCAESGCVGFVFEAETDAETKVCNKGQPCCFLKQTWLQTQSKGIASAYRVTRKGDPGVNGNPKSFLEGCVRGEDAHGVRDIFSSGTEDYFLGTYYFNRGPYTNPVAGLTDLDNGRRTFSAYRIHDADPLYFEEGLRLTWRNSDPYGACDLNAANRDAHAITASSFALVYEWNGQTAAIV